MPENIKPCRKCHKIPDVAYPPSRVMKSDWICVKCSNKDREKWMSTYRIKRKKAQDLEKVQNQAVNILGRLDLIKYLDNTPVCPFCDLKLIPSRTKHDKGEPLKWRCVPCNDIIQDVSI